MKPVPESARPRPKPRPLVKRQNTASAVAGPSGRVVSEQNTMLPGPSSSKQISVGRIKDQKDRVSRVFGDWQGDPDGKKAVREHKENWAEHERAFSYVSKLKLKAGGIKGRARVAVKVEDESCPLNPKNMYVIPIFFRT